MPQTFNHAVITNNGAALLNRAQAGEVKIEFTRIVVGNGIYADSEKELSVLQERTALKNQKNSYALSDIEVYTDRSVKVTALITNYDSVSNQTLVNQGYYINEMGLYARPSGDTGEADILYSIAVISSETGDFMPPYNGYNPAEIIQEYYATVSSSANVTIQKNMGAPALADDLQDTNVRVDSLEKSRVWFWNCGNRKVDTEKSVDVEGFRLFQGVRIVIHFQWGNTAADFTMNVNGTGNIPVRYRGAPVPADYIRAGHFVELVYYDNCWNVVGDLTQAQVDALETRLDGLTPADIGALPSSGNAVSASKWNTVRKINGMSVDGTTDRTNYGVCSTSGSTTAKTVSSTGFSLITGAEITVKFNNTNTASNPTLNVNSTGAKAIYYKGKAVPSGYILSGGTYTFRYNGTQWELVGDINTDTTYSEATVSKSGLMSAGDKAKVDSLDNNYADKNIYGDTFVSLGRYGTVGEKSFAFGESVEASGNKSHAEGYGTTASGFASHAEGRYTTASGYASHAEGYDTTASMDYSHAEGWNAQANGNYSHAEGRDTTASGNYSHVEGYNTIAENECSHVCGKYNYNASNYGSITGQVGDAFIIGNGTSGNNRSNVFRVMYDGNIYGKKAFQSSGADYAEFIKPWADGNPDGEDRAGYFVTVKNGLLYKAEEGDYIYGITSGNPSIVGNADEDYYWRYERDEFNRIVMEDVPEMIQAKDEDGNLVFDEETHEPVMVETGNIIPNARMKLAEGYDPSLQGSYIERKDRKEWDYVGMLGVLPVRDDGTCLPDHYCKCGQGGIATFAAERGFDTYMVIERISDNIVSVILK